MDPQDRLLLKMLDGRVELYEVDVLVDETHKRLSYTILLDGKTIRRFLFIDCGLQARNLAFAYFDGLVTGILESTPKETL